MAEKHFIKHIDVNESVEKVFQWHENIGAFQRLTPPWMKLRNVHKTGNGIQTGTTVNMDILFANIPFPIKAEHIDYKKNNFFKDRLYGGIFSKWEHTHTFLSETYSSSKIARSSSGVGSSSSGIASSSSGIESFSTAKINKSQISRLEDRIDYALPFHIPDKWHRFITSELYRLFNYRHSVMVGDLYRHRDFQNRYENHRQQQNVESVKASSKPKYLTILISGASGPVGSSLVPFLTTGGHRVIKLVRKNSKTNDSNQAKEEIQWNPFGKELDLEEAIRLKSIDKIDVVINLNGYHIGSGRWTEQTKNLIVQSRNLSTTLLAEKISSLPQELKPELFISASATGFYGDCGESCLDENSCSGDLFISQVCSEWESCAKKAEDSGIRTVFARMGVVLTPAGGALERLLPSFMMGLGAKIGTGKQYMSWISIDDLVYSLYHIISNRTIQGAVNLIAPNPVTNEEFTQILSKVVSRPARFTIPESFIRMVWGKMGEEVLLASSRVIPDRLIHSGFSFSHPTLEQALRHLIGKQKSR